MILNDPRYNAEDDGCADEHLGYSSLQHLLWMLERIPELPPTKACRWLGYVQGTIIHVSGLTDVDKERDVTRTLLREYDRLVCGEGHG